MNLPQDRMPRPRILVAVFVYNEGEKLRTTLGRFPETRTYDIVVMDDGSDDNPQAVIAAFGFTHLRHEVNRGAGAAIRTVIGYANENRYDILVLIAGNAKMHPSDIPGLLQPILDGRADYVQGSRYLEGGRTENLPRFRRLMIPLFTRIVYWLTGFRGTDATCGMRAYRLELTRRPELDLSQPWLDRYEMEYYLHFYAIRLGYRLVEAPVAMTYPPEMKNYSKIRALVGWWSMIRPWVYLTLGWRR